MNQSELQLMANERILDAHVLMSAGRWSFAYYVGGYAVECAIKSSILARMVTTGGVFRDKKFAESCWTHDFRELIRLADLKAELDNRLAASATTGGAFVANWAIVGQWKETSRYEAKTRPECIDLYQAITNNADGVLPWIQNYW